MSKLADELFSGLKRFGSEIGAELHRLGKQGANEMAAAIFSNSNAFVQYGTGQETQEPKKEPEVEKEIDNSIEC
jgi:hypothetical protein